jgi:hypothetical protein
VPRARLFQKTRRFQLSAPAEPQPAVAGRGQPTNRGSNTELKTIMTATLEAPTEEKTATVKPISIAQRDDALLKRILPDNFGAEEKPALRKLQAKHETLAGRVEKLNSRSADGDYLAEVAANPGTQRTIASFEDERQRTYRALFGEMNAIACEATAVNAKLSVQCVELINKEIDDVMKKERAIYAKYGLPYSESALVASIRKLQFKFSLGAKRTTTSGDVNCSPRAILASFFDL